MAVRDKMDAERTAFDDAPADRPGFDVTCVVGRVELFDGADKPAHVAAFELIARHDAPGTYKFPMADGRVCSVDVWYGGEES